MMNKRFFVVFSILLFLASGITLNGYAMDDNQATNKIKGMIKSDLNSVKLDEIKNLLKQGADINVTDGNGNTLLIIASLKGHMQLVKVLVDAGADINRQNINGVTAFIIASLAEHRDIANYLDKKGAANNKAHKRGMRRISKFVTFNKVISVDLKKEELILELKGPVTSRGSVLPKGGIAHLRCPLLGLVFFNKDLKPSGSVKVYWGDPSGITSFRTEAVKGRFKRCDSRGSMLDLDSYNVIGFHSANPSKNEILREHKRMLSYNPPKTIRIKKKPTPKKSTPKKLEERKKHEITPLEKIGLDDLKLVAIMRITSNRDRWQAVIEDPKGRGYIVRKGTYIGLKSGKVKAINEDAVIVEEVYKIEGKYKTKLKTLKLTPSSN